MAGLKLAVLFTLIYTVYGQTDVYLDLGSGISRYQNAEEVGTVVSVAADSANGRRMCVTAGNVFYTNGATVVSDTGTIILTAPGDADIFGLACCCDLFIITYRNSNNNNIYVRIYDNTQSVVVVEHQLSDSDASTIPPVKCDPDLRRIVLVSTTNVWVMDFNSLATIVRTPIMGGPLASGPTCIACRSTGENSYDIFVSIVGDAPVGYILNMTAGTVTAEAFGNAFEAIGGNLVCLDLDGSGTLWMKSQLAPMAIAFNNIDVTSADSNVNSLQGFIASAQNGMVYGISVCDSACQDRNCTPVNCSCDQPCGFCVYDNSTCQCDNSFTSGCIYENSTIAEMCEACLEYPNAALVIQNPLPKRIGGEGTIRVFGVLKGNGGITVRREVRMGRFGPANWPTPNDASVFSEVLGSGERIGGFLAAAGVRLRGSRFGVWVATIDSNSANVADVNIIGVSTENSGFTNALYTSTVNNGGTVVLQASMTDKLMQFEPTLQWSFTRVDQTTNTVYDTTTPPCSFPVNNLGCMLTGVTKEVNEGEYEVFRPPREQRNWHPDFFLFVRSCGENEWGRDCDRECSPACVHGYCDTTCGRCVCFPGWMGDGCNTACGSENLIGASCDIECSDLVDNANNCVNLLICLPYKVGCACRSGLQPPECKQECEDGKYGPNCRENCAAGCTGPCNKMTGVC